MNENINNENIKDVISSLDELISVEEKKLTLLNTYRKLLIKKFSSFSTDKK